MLFQSNTPDFIALFSLGVGLGVRPIRVCSLTLYGDVGSYVVELGGYGNAGHSGRINRPADLAVISKRSLNSKTSLGLGRLDIAVVKALRHSVSLNLKFPQQISRQNTIFLQVGPGSW